MKRLNTSALLPGMIIAEDVYTYSDQLIFPKGITLTEKAITKLEFYSILNVLVENEQPVPEPNLDESFWEVPYSKKLKQGDDFKKFKARFDQGISTLKTEFMNLVEKNEPIKIPDLLDDTLSIVDFSMNAVSYFDLLHNLRDYDDPTYAHSINVGLISYVFSGWLKMNAEERRLATACGLLHDIGKLMIPAHILDKKEPLTPDEMEVLRSHPAEGYSIIRNMPWDIHIKNTILMHHERFDGSGYPLSLKRERIDKYAKIVAIADVYESMTSARTYREGICPFKVLEHFERDGLQKYDTGMLMTFIENIANSFMLNTVRLSNNQEGVIVYINHKYISRPTIKCGEDYVDLTQHPELSIEAML